MTKVGIALAAALMLSGASGVYAQAGPPDKNPSPQAEGRAPAPTDKGAATESMKGDAAPSQMERRVDEQAEPKGGDGKKSGKAADKDKDDKGDKKDRQAEDRKDGDKGKTGANDKPDDKASSKGAEAKDKDSKDSDKVKGAESKDKDGDKTKGAETKDMDKSKQPDAKADNKAMDKDGQKPTTTTGSKDVPATGDAAKNAQGKDAAKSTQTTATPPADGGKQPNAGNQAAGDRKDAAAAKAVQLTGEKKDRVRTAFKDKPSVKHITNVEININVGTRAPSSWEYADVPIVVIETVPEYRGYRYAWVEDHYVIVEPATYEIVAVIDAPGGRADASSSSSGGGRGSRCADLSLNDDDRAFILRSVEINRGVTINGVELGWSVPDSIELRPFPDPVITRSAKLGSCRYFVVEDRIAIVDPDGDKVVLLIDNRR